jgi:hypothetical protein
VPRFTDVGGIPFRELCEEEDSVVEYNAGKNLI